MCYSEIHRRAATIAGDGRQAGGLAGDLFHHQVDRRLQLGVVAGEQVGGLVLHLDVRIDAVVLHRPLAVGGERAPPGW
jgi:hypothetical protein